MSLFTELKNKIAHYEKSPELLDKDFSSSDVVSAAASSSAMAYEQEARTAEVHGQEVAGLARDSQNSIKQLAKLEFMMGTSNMEAGVSNATELSRTAQLKMANANVLAEQQSKETGKYISPSEYSANVLSSLKDSLEGQYASIAPHLANDHQRNYYQSHIQNTLVNLSQKNAIMESRNAHSDMLVSTFSHIKDLVDSYQTGLYSNKPGEKHKTLMAIKDSVEKLDNIERFAQGTEQKEKILRLRDNLMTLMHTKSYDYEKTQNGYQNHVGVDFTLAQKNKQRQIIYNKTAQGYNVSNYFNDPNNQVSGSELHLAVDAGVRMFRHMQATHDLAGSLHSFMNSNNPIKINLAKSYQTAFEQGKGLEILGNLNKQAKSVIDGLSKKKATYEALLSKNNSIGAQKALNALVEDESRIVSYAQSYNIPLRYIHLINPKARFFLHQYTSKALIRDDKGHISDIVPSQASPKIMMTELQSMKHMPIAGDDVVAHTYKQIAQINTSDPVIFSSFVLASNPEVQSFVQKHTEFKDSDGKNYIDGVNSIHDATQYILNNSDDYHVNQLAAQNGVSLKEQAQHLAYEAAIYDYNLSKNGNNNYEDSLKKINQQHAAHLITTPVYAAHHGMAISVNTTLMDHTLPDFVGDTYTMMRIVGIAGHLSYLRNLNQRVLDDHAFSGTKIALKNKKKAINRAKTMLGDVSSFRLTNINQQLMLVRQDGLMFPITPKDIERAKHTYETKDKKFHLTKADILAYQSLLLPFSGVK